MKFEKLGYLSTIVANYNTNAYTAVRFENYLTEYGRLEGALRTDHATGMFYKTNRPLDIAITGAGFIPVTQKDGTSAYTRDGSFSLNTEGYLVTNDGAIVGEGIKIPINYNRLMIEKDGKISVIKEKGAEPEEIGKIPMVVFNNPEGLKQIDGNKMAQTEESGEPALLKDHDYIKQGGIERSNVNIFSTVNSVLQLNASMIASARIIKVTDDIYRQSISLRQ